MRRGLIAWSPEEVPASTLDARVARLQSGMRADSFDAMLVYSSFAAPGAASYLTHFVPYWNEALVVLFPRGAPVILAAFSKRVQGWVRAVSHVGEVVAAPQLGAAAVKFLAERAPNAKYVGVVDLAGLPWSVAEPLVEAGYAPKFVEALGLFTIVRQPADVAESAVARRALAIAEQALRAVPADARDASAALAAADRAARAAGAEEVIARVAPDLAQSARLERIEGERALGERYALELSVAYKGVWTRAARARAGASAAGFDAARAWLANAAVRATDLDPKAGFEDRTLPPPPGRVLGWRLEAALGPQPLGVVAASDAPALTSAGGSAGMPALPAGSIAIAGAEIALDAAHGGGFWVGRVPITVGAHDTPGQELTA